MMASLDLKSILEYLGYRHSSGNWEEYNSEGSFFPVREVVGTYHFQTSPDGTTPPRPVVHVAEVKDDAHAREVHRKLWNVGDCPFLILLLPHQVRIYSGFHYDHRTTGKSDTIFAEVIRSAQEIARDIQSGKLSYFSSQAIDSGQVWTGSLSKYLNLDGRVDQSLLRNLKKLSERLQQDHGLSQNNAHSLIGKFIYFRYLKDRGILTPEWLISKGIQEEDVFGRHATKEGFEGLSTILQERFNGEIFPLSDYSAFSDSVIKFVASVFHGDDIETGQQVLDFGAYDFAYIPVELLSAIYEQFLHEQNISKKKDTGGDAGAYYTPKPLADYVLAELESICPLTLETRVLDPSCGSGIFLVLAYQRLINLHRHIKQRELAPQELSDLLTQQIYGVEINSEACRIAEFSLLLTLLSHLKPPDLIENEDFHFPCLRGRNIFEVNFFSDENPLFANGFRFNWIAGNPPWISYKSSPVTDPQQEKERQVAVKWIDSAKKSERPIGKLRACEAFCWHVSDLLDKVGHAALLIHATTLVNEQSREFRKAFFKSMEVRRITNFTNLAGVLFEKPTAPAASVVYTNAVSGRPKQSIIHVAPFMINQIPLQQRKGKAWTITINESEIQWIRAEDAEKDGDTLRHSLFWKECLWGTYHDRRTLQRLRRLLPTTLGEVIDRQKWIFGRGPEIKSADEADERTVKYQPAFENKKVVDMDRLNRLNPAPLLEIPVSAITELPKNRYFYRVRGGDSTISFLYAPHILINATFALYSDLDCIIPDPQIGISGTNSDSQLLKAIVLFLNSYVGRYCLFFISPTWGVSVDKINRGDIEGTPSPSFMNQQVNQLSQLYDRLSSVERSYFDYLSSRQEVTGGLSLFNEVLPPDLQSEIDKGVGEILGIPEWIRTVAREFMQTRNQLLKGKLEEGRKATEQTRSNSPIAQPSVDRLTAYAEHLRKELDTFAGFSHRVSIFQERDTVTATVEITDEQIPLPVEISTSYTNETKALLDAVRYQNSQWVYIQRSVRYFENDRRVHLIKQNRLLDWTQTQAFLDAGDIIGGALAEGK